MTDDQDDPAPDDRFGVSWEAIRSAVERHRGILRAGLYVPNRYEVRTAPLDWLGGVLMDWLWESPTELVPTDAQVEEVIAVLQAREDADTAEGRQLIAKLRSG